MKAILLLGAALLLAASPAQAGLQGPGRTAYRTKRSLADALPPCPPVIRRRRH